jgi:tetratricopeptide (TPR) repeat protein
MKPLPPRLLGPALAALIAAAPLLAQPANPGSSAPASVAADSAADQLVAQGEQLSSQGRQDDALAAYEAALQRAPNLADAHLGTGVALDLEGQYVAARGHLRRAIALAAPGPAKARALRTMAVSYAFTRSAAEAATYERQVIDAALAKRDYAGAADVDNELARIFLESGDLASAYTWYHTGHETALRIPNITPEAKDLWDFRWEHAQARIAARRGEQALALQHVTAAKAILDRGTNPGQLPFFPYLTGYVALYTGDYSSAITDLAQADRHDPFVLSLIAQTYEKTGDKSEAIRYYQQVLNQSPHNPPNAFARPLARQKLAALGAS